MFILRGTKKINKVVTELLQKFFDKKLTAFMGTDFGYYYIEDEIEYSIVVSEKMNRYFSEFIEDTYGIKFTDVFIISLLHEVGHFFTIDDIGEDEYLACQGIKETLTTSKEDTMEYFNLIDERMATDWAIDYYKNNRENVLYIAETIEKEIKEFIKLNGIVDN